MTHIYLLSSSPSKAVTLISLLIVSSPFDCFTNPLYFGVPNFYQKTELMIPIDLKSNTSIGMSAFLSFDFGRDFGFYGTEFEALRIEKKSVALSGSSFSESLGSPNWDLSQVFSSFW